MREITNVIAVLTVWMAAVAVPATAQPSPTTPASLDVRVTADYRNRSALEVLQTLTRAAGLTLDVATGTLLPVTIVVTNVRLETALTATCENASCRWTLHDRVVVVTPVPIDIGTLLPRSVSIALREASIRDVFRALAAALNVQLVLEGELPDTPVSLNFHNTPPVNVLNVLAQFAQCSWQFEPGRLIVRRLP